MKAGYNLHNSASFNNVHKERVGQLINYIAFQLEPNLYCTKLIKLLYIIDETAISRYGAPITWLKYYVWEMGPVPETVWLSVKNNNEVFGDYFDVVDKEGNYNIRPISQPDLLEFTEAETEIIDEVINNYGHKHVDELVDYLHRNGGLWDKYVSENQISFEKSKSTHYVIDLTELIREDEYKMRVYEATEEEINILESLA